MNGANPRAAGFADPPAFGPSFRSFLVRFRTCAPSAQATKLEWSKQKTDQESEMRKSSISAVIAAVAVGALALGTAQAANHSGSGHGGGGHGGGAHR
ncbi:MAG: hypothetical protein ACLPIC_20010 [Rhodoblastus sp.]|uniref:hypothetical protein n=1 Tax=Rhodoblastus sp. TaxID=1962975 RepID=UPI003F958982